MKKRDIINAIGLLQKFSDSEAIQKALHELDVKNDEVTAKLKELAEKSASEDSRTAMLNAQAAGLTKREQAVADAEARLKDAETQHQNEMERDRKWVKDGMADIDKRAAEKAAALDEQERGILTRANELTQREKALAKRELDAEKRDEGLTYREQALLNAQEQHNARVKRLQAAVA